MTGTRVSLLATAVALVPLLAACGISVDKDDDGRNKKVSITSPVGKLSVNANSDTPPDTGLAVHAGARALHDKEHDNANVNIEGGFFGVKVAVARYEDDMQPSALLEYYRKELAQYGQVSECHGNLDFKKTEARCRERDRGETQLGAGSEADSHIVSVKPRGSGSEFTLVHVQTKG
jgi:hypothetical protein